MLPLILSALLLQELAPSVAALRMVDSLTILVSDTGAVRLDMKPIGPFEPQAAATFKARLTLGESVKGSLLICRETPNGSVCKSLDALLPSGK